ncbi:DUF874 family protein [Helicobacter pylori]|uniref:DUF874 family protein n=3 Tax=Helicobacter pylori TaxID=210 RepID=UPI0003AC6132|nr:DUF874 family protein [Helicobacter pylori]EPZ95187.1 hypothetical protein N204_08555 [Helicobacter pylori UM085]WRC87195.1 DUF874 family protein [Helicobacter pylori]WRC87196.1 DUF874 family protein [Helicobacter pylori]
MPVIRVLVMLATMMMKLVKTAKEKKVFKNVGVSIMGITFWEAIKDSIKKQIKKSDWICGNVKTADDYLKTHPNSWLNSTIGVVTITTMLMNVCFADDQSKKEVAQAQKEAENARDRANKSGIELGQEQQKTSNIETNNQIKVEQEKQKTSNIETNNQIKVEQEKQKTEQEKQKTEQEKQKTEQEKQKTIKAQKDFIKYAEQNCQEKHNQFFIKKAGIKGGAIEVEAECKTPKPTKTNQTPIQPKHLPNSKQPRSQRGSKAQELIAYLQKELESLPYSQKAIVKQVDFYKPSSIAYLELDPRDFKVTEEWQNENLKIRSKAQAKMLEMRKPQANLSPFQSFSIIQEIAADINKEIEASANTEKKVEKASYGYSKRM